MNKRSKLAIQSSLLAALFSLSAHAGLFYEETYTAPFPTIPQGGTTFSIEHTFTGLPSSITSFELILTFNDNTSLSGNSSGIKGLLTLGTDTGSPFVSFFPTPTHSGSGSQQIYDITFSGASGNPGAGFNGLNPNTTWSLVLWDNSTSGIENGLVSWSLGIEAVPEPVNVALGIFGGVFLVVVVVRSRSVRDRMHRWRVAFVAWVDVV